MLFVNNFVQWFAAGGFSSLLSLYEPSTVLTDFLLAAAVWCYALLLARSPFATQKPVRLWMVTLSAAGVAALAGGLHHALFPESAPLLRALLWKGVGLSTSIASAAMLSAGIFSTLRSPWRRWAVAATLVKGILFVTSMWWWDDFRFIIYDYASAMIILAILQIGLRRQSPATGWIVGGIAISFVAAAIQQSGFDLHQYLNHNDLYHLVQIVAFHFFYLGARQLQDAEAIYGRLRLVSM
jgi:hypothetical protein